MAESVRRILDGVIRRRVHGPHERARAVDVTGIVNECLAALREGGYPLTRPDDEEDG